MAAAASLFPTYTEADWRKAAEAALKGVNVETLLAKTADGVRIEPVYRPGESALAIRPQGPWRIMARVDQPNAHDANAQALDDLANGADGLQITFSGAPGAYGYGLRQHDSAAVHIALEGVRLDAGTNFELDLATGDPDQALHFGAFIERSGAKPEDCVVAFALDPFAMSARGPFIADWSAQAKLYVGTALALRSKGFRGPLMVADARAVHAAGGSPAQELAFALAAAVGILRLFEGTGMSPSDARALIAFRLAADADQLATLSKFRALRSAWSRIEQACGLEPRAPYVQAESAWRMMTVRDPYVNVMRGAAAAFSAGLGGADSVSILPHTLAAGLPDSLARRLARNAQLILVRESNLGFVSDPAAGAGAFEAITQALCDNAWLLFQEIEGQGGLPSTLASGLFQRHVAVGAAALEKNVARLRTPITGVSLHADLAERPVELAVAAPEREVIATTEGGLAPIRLAEPFERLRDLSDAFLQRIGIRPRVYLAALGPEVRHRRRVQFVREWLEAGGFDAVYDGETTTAHEAVERARAGGALLACLCGADDAYAEHAAAFARAFKASGVKSVALAGRPGEYEGAWRDAGVDDFIFVGEDAVATMQSLYARISVPVGSTGVAAP